MPEVGADYSSQSVNADDKDRTMQCINKTRHGTTVA